MVKQCEEKSRRFNCTVNVVILDDELAFAEMLDKQIEIHCIKKDWLYESQIYTSGRELLEKDLSRVQIVFLDIDMPEQSGLDIAKILREHYPELILVFVTAFIEYSTARDVEIRDNRIVLRETGSLEHGYGLKNVMAVLDCMDALYVFDYRQSEHLLSFSAQFSIAP